MRMSVRARKRVWVCNFVKQGGEGSTRIECESACVWMGGLVGWFLFSLPFSLSLSFSLLFFSFFRSTIFSFCGGESSAITPPPNCAIPFLSLSLYSLRLPFFLPNSHPPRLRGEITSSLIGSYSAKLVAEVMSCGFWWWIPMSRASVTAASSSMHHQGLFLFLRFPPFSCLLNSLFHLFSVDCV